MVEFISYNGKYPCLCTGELILRIDGKEVGDIQLVSGGSVSFDENWEEQVTQGPWRAIVPPEYKDYKDEIEKVINENVRWGCCGGCV